MTLTSITAAVTGAYSLAKQIRRTWWHTAVEMIRGNLQRKKYNEFDISKGKADEKKPDDHSDDLPCGDV